MSQEGAGSVGVDAVSAAAMDGIAVTVDGEIVHANAALETLVEREDLPGESWRVLFPAGTCDRIEGELLDRVAADGEWCGRVSARRASGSTFAATLSIRAADDGESIAWALRDDGGEDGAELDRFETIIETAQDGIYSLDENLEFDFVNESLCEMVGLPAADLLGESVADFFVYDDEYAFAAELRERILSGDSSVGTVQGTSAAGSAGRLHLETRYRLHPEPDEEFKGSVGIIRDVTERVERERELETLNRINELLLDTVREALRTPSRDAVEGAVCERVLALDRYDFAWIGERTLDDGEILPRATAGGDEDFLADLPLSAAEGETTPIDRAFSEQSVQVANVEAAGSPGEQSVLADRGFESQLVVPLRHERTVYGALVVYSTEVDAFSDRERDGFAVLGEALGYILNAIKTRQLLFADSVVELELEVADDDSLLFGSAAALDCSIEIAGVVETGSLTLLYADVDGTTSHRLVDHLEDAGAVDGARVIDDEDRQRVEIAFDGSVFVDAVRAAGASFESARIGPEGARLVVEVPAAADTREFLNHATASFDHVDLLARRQRNRPPALDGRLEGPLEDLTDRQRTALEIAYAAGYFDWPRASTAEELAESMNISAPTLHYHLRRAEAGLLSSIFD